MKLKECGTSKGVRIQNLRYEHPPLLMGILLRSTNPELTQVQRGWFHEVGHIPVADP